MVGPETETKPPSSSRSIFEADSRDAAAFYGARHPWGAPRVHHRMRPSPLCAATRPAAPHPINHKQSYPLYEKIRALFLFPGPLLSFPASRGLM